MKIVILIGLLACSVAVGQTRPAPQAVADILDRAKADAMAVVQNAQGATSVELQAARAAADAAKAAAIDAKAEAQAAKADAVAAKADALIAQVKLDSINGQISDQVNALGIVRRALIASTQPSATPVPVPVKPPATRPSARTLNVGPGKAYATIAAASADAQTGDVVQIFPGVYREPIQPVRAGVTYSATPGSVWVDGAVVLTGWQKSGTSWSTAWTADFFNGPDRNHLVPAPLGCAEQFLWAPKLNADTGEPLRHVLTQAELQPGTFTVDWSTRRVFLRVPGDVDPSTGTLLGSRLARLAGKPDAPPGCTISGVYFRHAANFAQSQNAAVVAASGWQLVDVVVERAGGGGVGVRGDGITLNRVTARDCGQQGIGGGRATNVQIVDCSMLRNNTKGWSTAGSAGEAGGGKFAASSGLRITGMLAAGNFGPGLWFDIDNSDVVISKSTFRDNRAADAPTSGPGLFLELSQGNAAKPIWLDGCTFSGNVGAGVLIAETAHVEITGCTFSNNGVASIELRQGYQANGQVRSGPNGLYPVTDLRITGNRFVGQGVKTTGTHWEGWTPASQRIVLDRNSYELPAGGTLVKWWRASYGLIGDLRLKLGVEMAGTSSVK